MNGIATGIIFLALIFVTIGLITVSFWAGRRWERFVAKS